jgi:serine/threonine-protein kinase haspin
MMPALIVLPQFAGVAAPNSTQGFVQTYGCGVCRGRYAGALVKEWRAWDKRNGFVVFVVANGGADLEHFEVHSFEEARSIILQV